MGGAAGIEPATSGVGVRRSATELHAFSFRAKVGLSCNHRLQGLINGVVRMDRTSGLQIRNLTLFQLSYDDALRIGWRGRARTCDLCIRNTVLFQLSYTPIKVSIKQVKRHARMASAVGIEPTSKVLETLAFPLSYTDPCSRRLARPVIFVARDAIV